MTRFDHFMQAALYHPQRGYYTTRIKAVGTRGDFTTTPQLSDCLARAIAQQFLASGCRHLIEIGPGTGQLAAAVRQALPLLARLRTPQHLIEISAPLRALQQQRLPKAQHHPTLPEALAAVGRSSAFLYSNELVDAFPVRIFRQGPNGFEELYLEKESPTWTEHFLPVAEPPNSVLFQKTWPLGQRFEVHESYQHWLAEWLPCWQSGHLLTIDYLAPHPRPLGGTLRGYFLQARLTGPELYEKAGHLDLTADVEFEDLTNWGRALGLETCFRQSQREFLLPFAKNNPADQFLLDPQGAGEAFHVLLQKKKTPKSLSTV